MDKSNLTFYDSWDLTIPEIPPRSHLYNLPPIGVKTFDTESLTSYIGRLSYAHKLQSKVLINELVLPIIKQNITYAFKGLSPKMQFSNNTYVGSYLLDYHPFTHKFVRVIEQLTCQSNLFFLTFLSLNKFFSFSPTTLYRQWCPVCYEEMLIKKQRFYDPLFWSIHSVKSCPYHQQKLYSKCFHCQSYVLLLSPPGYCSKCRSWLGCHSIVENGNHQLLTDDSWLSDLETYRTLNSIDIFREIMQNLSKNKYKNIQANITRNLFRYLKNYYPNPLYFFDSLLRFLCPYTIDYIAEQYFRYQDGYHPPALSSNYLFILGYSLKISLINLSSFTYKNQ